MTQHGVVRLADVFRVTEDIPAGLRLRIALDLVAQFQGAGHAPLEPRTDDSTLRLDRVVVDATGVATVEGTGSGLLELVWEVLAGQPQESAVTPALADLVPGIPRDVEVQLALGEAADDVDDFAIALEEASRGHIDTHDDVRRALAAVATASLSPRARPMAARQPAAPLPGPAVDDEQTTHDPGPFGAADSDETAANSSNATPEELAPDSDHPTAVSSRAELSAAGGRGRLLTPLDPRAALRALAARRSSADLTLEADAAEDSTRDTLVPEGGLGAELLQRARQPEAGESSRPPALAALPPSASGVAQQAAPVLQASDDPDATRAARGGRAKKREEARPPKSAPSAGEAQRAERSVGESPWTAGGQPARLETPGALVGGTGPTGAAEPSAPAAPAGPAGGSASRSAGASEASSQDSATMWSWILAGLGLAAVVATYFLVTSGTKTARTGASAVPTVSSAAPASTPSPAASASSAGAPTVDAGEDEADGAAEGASPDIADAASEEATLDAGDTAEADAGGIDPDAGARVDESEHRSPSKAVQAITSPLGSRPGYGFRPRTQLQPRDPNEGVTSPGF